MSKVVATILLGILVFYRGNAQDKRDLINLKDGNRLVGKLLEYKLDGHVVFAIHGIDTLNIDPESIRSIRIGKGDFNQTNTGFWNLYEAGLQFDSENGHGLIAEGSLQGTWGYQWSRLKKFGFGIGYEGHQDFNVVPVFLSYQGEWFERKVTPYHFVNVGYAFAWEAGANGADFSEYDDVKGGFRFNPGIGVKFHQQSTFITLAVGYSSQKVSFTRPFWSWWADEPGFVEGDRWFNKMSVRFGIGF